MTCLGNTLPFVVASRDLSSSATDAAQVAIGSAASPAPVRAALEGFTGRLRALQARGLRMQSVWVLFRTYVNGASNDILRGCWTSAEWCDQYDMAVASFVESLLDAQLEHHQRDSGCP
jgi:hypothetical protein